MTRATLIAALMTALFAGPSFAAGAAESDSGDAVEDEEMAPRLATLPGSYVALPTAIVEKIRHKIQLENGEGTDDHAPASGGH